MDYIYELTGILHHEHIEFVIQEWKISKEMSKYYDLVSSEGKRRRIEFAKYLVVRTSTKHYSNGFLSAFVFCPKEDLDDMQIKIIEFLREKILNYEDDLKKNRAALDKANLHRNVNDSLK